MRVSLFFSTVTTVALLTVGLVAPAVNAVGNSANTGSPRVKITVPQETVPTGELATITLVSKIDAVCSGKILVADNTYTLTEQAVKKDVPVAWGFTPGANDNGKAKVYIKCGKEKSVAYFYVGTGKPNQPSMETPPSTSPDCTEKNTSCNPTSTPTPAPSTDCVKQNTACNPEQASSESDKTYASTVFSRYPNLSSRFTAEKIAYLGHKACSAFTGGESVESVHKMFVGSGYLNAEETKAVIYTAAVIFCPSYKEAVLKAYSIS